MDMRDPDLEERERLERFAKWREAAVGYQRSRVRHFLVPLCVGTVLGALIGLVAGTVVRTSSDRSAPLAADQSQPPAGHLISPWRIVASESLRPGAVRASGEDKVSRPVEKVQTAAVELKAGEDRSTLQPPRSARREAHSSQRPRQAVTAPELPERSPSSVLPPRLRENTSDLGPSFQVRGLPLPQPPVPDSLDQPMPSEPAAAAGPSIASSRTVVTSEGSSVPAPEGSKEVTVSKDVAATDAPFPPGPVAATFGAGSTPARSTPDGAATSLRPVAVVTPAMPPVPRADVAKSQRPGTMERVKRLIGYMPEVRAGKAVYRWVKSQPPADPVSEPSTPSPQAR